MRTFTFRGAVFDDYTEDDPTDPLALKWSQVCTNCKNKYFFQDSTLSENPAINETCGIKDCDHEAEYYIDFINAIM